MRKGFASLILIGVVSIISLLGVSFFAKYQIEEASRKADQISLGATIYTTALTDTINQFRINVNSSTQNLNEQLTNSTSVDPGHLHSINVSTGTITTLTATTVQTITASSTNVSSTNVSASGYGLLTSLFFTSATGTNMTLTGIASTSQLYANSSTIMNLRDSQGNRYSTSTNAGLTLIALGETITTSTNDTVYRSIPTASSTFTPSSTASNLRPMFTFAGSGTNTNGAAGTGCAVKLAIDGADTSYPAAQFDDAAAGTVLGNLSFTYIATGTLSIASHTIQVRFTSVVGGPCEVNTSTWALYLIP